MSKSLWRLIRNRYKVIAEWRVNTRISRGRRHYSKIILILLYNNLAKCLALWLNFHSLNLDLCYVL